MTSTAAEKVIKLAATLADMREPAAASLEDAREAFARGRYDDAGAWALQSLAHSDGVGGPVYREAYGISIA